MAVLAALGGVTSTYVNAVSDAVHAALGIPGASQWAAGLHVLWIVLSMGILRKLGAGTITGVLKGVVELMSGNSHGVIILLVDLVAGLLVDFGFFIFNRKQRMLPYLVSGGLATASNVLVFQIFATLPQNILGLTAIIILFLVALASGLVFAGILPYLLVNALSKAGVVKIPERTIQKRKIGWWILLGVSIIAVSTAVYLRINLQGPQTIQIEGAVENPYAFPDNELSIKEVNREMEYRGVMTEYLGYPLLDIIDNADPRPEADTLLIEASDGYAFLISFQELNNNPNILLVQTGKGQNASFDIVGPESSKAWVRNVSRLSVIHSEGLTIATPIGERNQFDPNKWVLEMDSTQIALPGGSQKLQGVPLWKVIEANVKENLPNTVIFKSKSGSTELSWSEIQGNDDLRIFSIIEENGIVFTLAKMSGDVLVYPLTEIIIE
jgi:ABC-type thiamin/hydroxymethylpyrimidine transport system permease subunit